MITFSRLGLLGRFGNQLFQYAGTRLYAEIHGFTYAFPDWEGRRLFAGMSNDKCLMPNFATLLRPTVQLADVIATSWSERLLKPLGKWHRGEISELHRNPQENINLYGYLQDPFSLALLKKHRERVRSWFRFRPELDRSLRAATDTYRPWAAVHVRRGDVVKRGNAVPAERYLELLPNVVGRRNLYVASDDSRAANEFSAYCPFVISHLTLDIPSWAVDFWILMNSDILLAGGSTFSWWAAFLGNADYYSTPLTHTWPAGYTPSLGRNIL